MAHLSESARRLTIKEVSVHNRDALLSEAGSCTDVCLLRLPSYGPGDNGHRLEGIRQLAGDVSASLGPQATLVTLGEPVDLVAVHAGAAPSMRYQHWIAIKRLSPRAVQGPYALPQHHFGALIHTRYKSALRHTKTRIRYTFCPACDRTTKDYGGKKHTYHQYGTLMSDVWRDIACDLESDITPAIVRFADFLGLEPYRELRVLDCRPLGLKRVRPESVEPDVPKRVEHRGRSPVQANGLILGDCLEELPKLPNDSVDLAFADPPYNLGKSYTGYADDVAITEYFEWCDKWVTELARVLRPGRTCAVLNIPLWAIRHFLHMETVLRFQSWIAWDALGYPVRKIMPAHYAILCFSKGSPRELPGLTGEAGQTDVPGSSQVLRSLEPLAEGFCLRASCVEERRAIGLRDRGPLTDLWWDVHRLKHNSRRVDHPCQLPPGLMYRLISLFTKPGEIVLDCLNGAGTTTLAAHQLGREYIGIEISKRYHDLARRRHEEILAGVNPFRKAERILTAKNSPVPRRPKQRYAVPKRTLQLEVKRIANKLGRLPTRDEVIRYARYPIAYYDEYFAGWGEVCAAARTTGMSETRQTREHRITPEQLDLLDS